MLKFLKMGLEETTPRVRLGEGRSGVVFQSRDKSGKDIAIKVFTGGDFLTKLVNYVFYGASSAYACNENAMLSSHYRRNILTELVEYWFGTKLRVAESLGVKWNDEFKAYELQTEFIDGRNAALHHPFSEQKEGELSDLVDNVMRPLQDNLIEAGFDGSVWQAGKGNPVASNNFLLKNKDDGDYENKWVWIDLESGVPALFPLSLSSLFSFYLPKSIRHRRPLFDDVDINKLKEYIKGHKEDLESKFGSERCSSLCDKVDLLEFYQEGWKSVRRADRGITYQLKKGRITQEQADWYSGHPYIWYGREVVRAAWKGCNKLLGDLPWALFNKLCLADYKKIILNSLKFVFSEKYRSKLARDYVAKRIDEWKERKQLEDHEADFLRHQLETESTTHYLTDLLVHAGIKPLEMTVFPPLALALYFRGSIDYKTSGALVVWGGSLTRTAYTAGRIAYNMMKPENLKKIPKIPSDVSQFLTDTYHISYDLGIKEGIKHAAGKILGIERLIALGVGMVPTLGNTAYPVQMMYSGSSVDKDIGKIMLYDLFSTIGKSFPIWGGRDTLTEHFFNHFPDLIIRNRQPLPEN